MKWYRLSSEYMHDRQWLQSGPGDDRPLHKVCRGRALHSCLGRRDMRPSDHYLECKTWMSNDIPIVQLDSFSRRTYQGTHETFSSSSGSLLIFYHPQTKSLVERQNRNLVSMLRVYCSRYMTDWDTYFPQVMGAYNSTQRSTTGTSPQMMLTGHEKSLLLFFFYPEYEGKKTSPQV